MSDYVEYAWLSEFVIFCFYLVMVVCFILAVQCVFCIMYIGTFFATVSSFLQLNLCLTVTLYVLLLSHCGELALCCVDMELMNCEYIYQRCTLCLDEKWTPRTLSITMLHSCCIILMLPLMLLNVQHISMYFLKYRKFAISVFSTNT